MTAGASACAVHVGISIAFTLAAAVKGSAPIEQTFAPPMCLTNTSRPGNKPSLIVRQIQRVQNISVAEFDQKHAQSDVAVPLVFENSMTDFFDASQWTRQAIANECGHINLIHSHCEDEEDAGRDDDCHQVQFVDEAFIGKEWAGLVTADLDELNITTINDLLNLQDTPMGSGLYLHDAPLRELCPSAMKRLRVPKYFARDYVLLPDQESESAEEKMMDSGFPSIFVSKKGASSMLHTDGDLTRFWMLGLSGKKLWRVIPPSDYKRLYPTFEGKMHYYPRLFNADVMNPDFERFPLLDGAVAYEAVLSPGDVIFIPEGWAHQVLTLEDAISTSMNFVDAHSLDAHNKKNQHGMRVAGVTNTFYNRFLTSFMMPLDSYERSNPEENIEIEDYFSAHLLQYAGVPKSVKEWVRSRGEDGVDFFGDEEGVPTLHLAVEANFISVVKYLLEEGGADINIEDNNTGYTALTLAEDLEYTMMHEVLLQYLERYEKSG